MYKRVVILIFSQHIVYGEYGNPDLNTQLFTDSALTIPFNGGYQYWKWGLHLITIQRLHHLLILMEIYHQHISCP
jgi:hypothetical protein